MVKNNNNVRFLEFLRSEISFWLAIVGIIVGAVITFNKIEARVLASEVKVEETSFLLSEIDKKVDQLLINQAKTQKDIEYLINKGK